MDKVIDGVDVSECKLTCENGDCALYYAELNSDNPGLEYGFKCEDNDCYYKQLQRAKAEIEELKKKIEDLNFYIDSYRQTWEVDKYRKALQEIREIINASCDNCKYNKDGITCSIGDCGEGKLKIIENKINEVIGVEE